MYLSTVGSEINISILLEALLHGPNHSSLSSRTDKGSPVGALYKLKVVFIYDH